MTAFAPAIGVIALAALIGHGLAWLRPELDLRPRSAALWSALAATPAAAALAVFGGGGGAVVFFSALAALSVVDLKGRVLPDVVTLPLIAVGLVLAIPEGLGVAGDRLIGAGLGYGSLRAFEAAARRMLDRDGMGRGDAKLFAAIGAYLGWRALPEVALIAALAGVAYGLVVRPKDGEIPFGPPLALGAFLFWLAGPFLG